MSQQRQFHPENTTPRGKWILVFASDATGRHAKGYAKVAKVNFGAQYGQSCGPMGNAYAIPVTNHGARIPMASVLEEIGRFCAYAAQRPKLSFFITRMNTDEMSEADEQRIATAFAGAPMNCSLPQAWEESLCAKEATGDEA